MEHKNLKILIVDDIEDNRMIIRRICGKLDGVDLLEAENGEIAVNMTREYEPEIILMDIMMPVMDGFEASTIIKGEFPDSNIIVITALVDEEVEKSFLRLGIDGYLRKPLARGVLKVKLEGLIARLKIKNGTSTILSSKHTLNPFSKNIRKMKTIFDISTEDDMMNLGIWLTDYYSKNSAVVTMDFDFTLDTVYQFVKYHISNNDALSVIVEEDFESVYLNFICQKEVFRESQELTIEEKIEECVLFKDGLLHIKINMKSNYQPTALMAEDILNSTLASIGYSEDDFALLANIDEPAPHKEETDPVSAEEFITTVEETVMSAVMELASVEERFSNLLKEFDNTKSHTRLRLIGKEPLSCYIDTIAQLEEFETLCYGLSTTSLFLKTADEEHVLKNQEQISVLLKDILDGLKRWRREIFIDKSANDIHEFDSELFFSCIQVDGAIKLE